MPKNFIETVDFDEPMLIELGRAMSVYDLNEEDELVFVAPDDAMRGSVPLSQLHELEHGAGGRWLREGVC